LIDPFFSLTEPQIFKEVIRNKDGAHSGILEFTVVKGDNTELLPDKRVFKKSIIHPEVRR